MGEFLLLGIGSTRAFLAVLLYLAGILAILTRKYALTFFRNWTRRLTTLVPIMNCRCSEE